MSQATVAGAGGAPARVVPAAAAETLTLDRLPIGCTATVVALGQEGAERRRLLAVGFVPGARVTAHRRSPLGDPIAYRVRGGTVALRREQARSITVAGAAGAAGAGAAPAPAAAGGAA